MDFLNFIGKLGLELWDLYEHTKQSQPDPEKEKQLAMRIVRKAVDIQAEKEIRHD